MVATLTTRIVDHDPKTVGHWMHAQGAAPYREGVTCIGLEREGQLVAGAMFDGYNGASIFAHIAITGRITREWLWFISYYPFVQLGCQVVIGLVESSNLAAQRFDEHFGFIETGRIRQGTPDGDLIIYTLTKADCRFLRRPYGKT
jgi:hypothetical protein